MSEMPHADGFIDSKAGLATVVGSSSLAGAVYGMSIANYQWPTKIPYAEGIHANASLTFSPETVVQAPISDVVAPNIPVDTPLPGVNGIHTTIDQLQLNLSDKRSQGEYIGLLTNFHETVVKPTSEAILHHLALGAGVGAATAAGISYAAVRYARRVKKDNLETQEDIRQLSQSQSRAGVRSADRQEKKLARETNRRKFGTIAASLLLAAGVGNTARHAINIENTPSDGEQVALASILTDQVPELQGAKIIGGGDQINSVIFGINNLKERADKPWIKGAANLSPALNHYYQTVGKKYSLDPDVISIAHVTDLHCNLANYEYYFGPMVKLLDIDAMAVTGDTQTNSGTMFYEKNCIPGLQKIVKEAGDLSGKKIPIINEDGNHDNKDRYKGGPNFYDLNGNKNTENLNIEGAEITFIGKEDPRSTVWYPTTPVNPDDQNKGLVNQGESILKPACDSTNEGKTTIVMTHAIQGSYPIIAPGCATLVLNGHTHHERPVKSFVGDNGRLVLQHTGGSASGADTKLSVYEGPEQDATTTVFYYSISQKRFIGYYSITMHQNSSVQIVNHELPPPIPEPSSVVASMRIFNQLNATSASPKTNKDLAKNTAAKDKVAIIKNSGLAGR